MELLHMEIPFLLLEPDLDCLRFPKHKTGLGVDNPARVSVFLACHAICYLDR